MGIQIIRRNFDPAFSNVYHVSFSSSTKTMLVDLIDVGPDGCGPGPHQETIRLPALSIVSDGCYNDTPAAQVHRLAPQRLLHIPGRWGRTHQHNDLVLGSVTNRPP